MQLQNRNGVVNMAIMALVIGLILLSVGIYISKDRAVPAASVENEQENQMTDEETESVDSQPAVGSTQDIDKKLEELTLDEKNVDSALNDKPLDVMSE